jgi:glycosyltransferase involved in cell wall biosynthesis
MRVGHNPARYVQEVAQPADITVAVLNCIPFLSGYYEQSLEVLKVVVESLDATREKDHPYDVMVFDNHSCHEVRTYLQEAYEQHKIQYLVLSDTNIGKIGAWNYIFGAAQGKFIVFADGDVGFRPGWLKATLDLFKAFPNVGMVTARPLQTPMEFSKATLAWGQEQPPGTMEKGEFLRTDVYLEHMRSLGIMEETYKREFTKVPMYRLSHAGQQAFVGAAHFQFAARTNVLKEIIPLPSNQPMRGERKLDIAINDKGLLRLGTREALVWHIGNRLTKTERSPEAVQIHSVHRKFMHNPIIKKPLMWLYNRIFHLYFLDVE